MTCNRQEELTIILSAALVGECAITMGPRTAARRLLLIITSLVECASVCWRSSVVVVVDRRGQRWIER